MDFALPTAGVINPVSKETIRARVYTELKRALLSGVFKPGQVMIARVIAEQMGVGTMPVRESIQQLATEGGLEFLENRTVRVPTLTLSALNEIFEIRMKLECLAVEKAAVRITDAEVNSIRKFANLVAVPEQESLADACLAANYSFHFAIYHAAQAPHLLGMIETLWLKVGPLLILPYHSHGKEKTRFFATLEMHDRLVDLLASGRGAEAADQMREILERSRNWYNDARTANLALAQDRRALS